ncbi:MAG: hypothetical protein HY925_02830 [Elusimicrobia bacterium]|nr:hypothetical protein [Elusimicrobiota bacterium]
MISTLLPFALAATTLFAQTVRTSVPTVAPAGVGVAPVMTQTGGAALLNTPSIGLGASLLSPVVNVGRTLPVRGEGPAAGGGTARSLGSTAKGEGVAAALQGGSAATSLAAAVQALQQPGGGQTNRSQATGSKDQGAGQGKDAATESLFDGTAPKAEPKEWTFMVFLNGHNNLDRFGTLNMKQMEQVGSNDRVNIVVQWASLGKPTKRMLIKRSESGEVSSPVIESLPAVDMGDANQLYEFIKWTTEKFPAQRYMVDIWDHGSGWHIRRTGANRSVSPMDVSWDDQTGNHITTEQVGQVMAKVKALIGRPIDVLGFDACLMAMAEVVAEVKDSVRYFAGSEELEPGAGWIYDKALKQWLAAGPTDDGAALVKALTDTFVKAYGSAVTFSGLDLAKWDAFVAAAKNLAAEIAGLDKNGIDAVRKAARGTERYGFPDYGDYLHFVQLLGKGARVVSAPVLDAAARTLQELVIAHGSSKDRPNSNGLSVWLPGDAGLWRTHGKRYLELAWNKLTGWGEAAKRVSGAAFSVRKR